MISSFKIRNFKSILDLEIDFKFNEGKAPNGYEEFDNLIFLEPNNDKKERCVPCLAIYGANASGKSNIVNALEVLKRVILYGKDRYFIPNKLNKLYDSTMFELSFWVNKHKYTYKIDYNDKKINEESLKENDEIIFKVSSDERNFTNIVTKAYNKNKLNEIFEVECCNSDKIQIRSFLQKIASNYTGLNKPIVSAFNEINQNIDTYIFNDVMISKGINELSSLQKDASIDIAFDKIVSLLRKLDIDINRMELERKVIPLKEMTYSVDPNSLDEDEYFDSYDFKNESFLRDQIYTYHKDIDGDEVKFRFTEESEGTRTLAGIIGVFLAVLEKGGTLIVDELECSLHPLLLTEVVRMFKDKRYNKNKAQLIFTAHNTDILDADILRVSEIAIVRKTLQQGTTLRSISSFEGMRNVTNFRKQYLNGMFSGIPHPYI